MNIDRHFQSGFFQHVDLFVAMHGKGDIVTGQNRQFVRIEKSFQEQYRFFPADFAKVDGCLDFDQGQSVGVGKRPDGPFKPVAVGIGLDDGPDFRTGNPGTDNGKIVLHGSDVDTGN